MKGCEKSALWRETNYQMTFGEDLYLYSKAQICQTNNCNKGSITLPPIDNTENEKQCPQCYAQGDSCTPTVRKCVGQQTRCFKFSGGIFNGREFENLAAQGCTHEDLVHQKLLPFPETALKEGFKIEFPKDN